MDVAPDAARPVSQLLFTDNNAHSETGISGFCAHSSLGCAFQGDRNEYLAIHWRQKA